MTNTTTILIIFLDDQGEIVYQTNHDNNSTSDLSLKEVTTLKDEIQFYNGKTGMIVKKDHKILVFSDFGITDSNNSKKPVGNLIMGYFLDETKLKNLEEKLGIPFNISGVSESSKNPYEIKIEKDIVFNKFYIQTLSGESLILKNQRDANILFLGKENIKKYIVMLLINFLILIFVISIFNGKVYSKEIKEYGSFR
ncbi:CHASE4 domain-containing protein [Psychrilyobacter sp.]|uniref:CHASE4 domain-containing protein n=1 Tax=Psychrilyobacter sp. TaxID=2586924 RepID=UPI003019133E